MTLLKRLNVSRDKDGPRKFSFELGLSGVISVGIVVVLGMCWVFILGILVGRGYRPESAVPQIAEMMPVTEARGPNAGEPAEPPKVLKPEELQFMEDAQGKDGEVVADSTQKASDPKKAPKGRDLTDLHPVPAAPAATALAARPVPQPSHGAPKPAPSVPGKPAPTETARPAAKADPKSPFEKKDTARFTATYQVASFPGREQADTLVKQLAKKGITASINEAKSKKNKVFRVNIQLKGSEADIADALKRTGEKGPILLGKKPL